MPSVIMLVGLPGCGKSTWAKNFKQIPITGTDQYIEIAADAMDSTYDQVFDEQIKNATEKFMDDLRSAASYGSDLIIDQTNLTPKSRKRKLSYFDKSYTKIAMVFLTPEPVEWKRRLDSRVGKTIPKEMLQSMEESFILPTEDEGFDYIYFVETM